MQPAIFMTTTSPWFITFSCRRTHCACICGISCNLQQSYGCLPSASAMRRPPSQLQMRSFWLQGCVILHFQSAYVHTFSLRVFPEYSWGNVIHENHDWFEARSVLHVPARRGLGTPPTKMVLRGSSGWEPSITKSASLRFHGRIWTCQNKPRQSWRNVLLCRLTILSVGLGHCHHREQLQTYVWQWKKQQQRTKQRLKWVPFCARQCRRRREGHLLLSVTKSN